MSKDSDPYLDDFAAKLIDDIVNHTSAYIRGEPIVFNVEKQKAKEAIKKRLLEDRVAVLRPIDDIHRKIGEEYGELEAQEDVEAYVDKTLTQLVASIKEIS